jgi:hypothetical protein
MSKYETSLKGPLASKIHGGQYKTANVQNATAGRVIVDPKKSLNSKEMSRPSGRTSYTAGSKTASCDAK